jgi:hypothetical protein
MKLTRNINDRNIIINTEQDFQTDLGWQENLTQFEDEVLKDIINPIDNYETVRFIHKPYDKTISGVTFSQTDIWFQFYFLSGSTYVQNYEAVGITNRENELMLRQSTESFFRLEFFKTPWISGNTYEAPTRKNRRLVFSKNLSLPLGEKFLYTNNNSSYYIHIPSFTGSNYRNKENMYLFWFEDETVLEESNLIGTETGNTFFMTSKFYNGKDGTITDFTNKVLTTGDTLNESLDMYYRVDFNLTGRTYDVYTYTGGTKVGTSATGTSINFYEKGGGILLSQLNTPTPTPTSTNTPTPTPTITFTPTPTPTINSGGLNTMLGVKSGATLNLVCSGGGTNVTIYFSGTSIQLGEKLYSNNNLPNPTPVGNGYYYYPTYNTVYQVTNGLGSVYDTPICPTPTPIEFTIDNIWTSEALSSSPTQLDIDAQIAVACGGTSTLNNGTAFSMTAWGNNLCNASRVYDVPLIMLSEVSGNGIIFLRQTLNNYDGLGGNKLWYRKFQRSLIKDSQNRFYFEPIDTCYECYAPTPEPTPIPLITVNIYGKQNIPYNSVTNNLQLIYSTSSSPTTNNYTTSGIQKNTTELGTFLVSPSVNLGDYLNLGAFLRVTNGTCDYVEVNVNVFSAGTFSNSRFTDSTGSITSISGCGLQGTLNGVSIAVGEPLDVYLTTTSTLCGFTGIKPLTCLTTDE